MLIISCNHAVERYRQRISNIAFDEAKAVIGQSSIEAVKPGKKRSFLLLCNDGLYTLVSTFNCYQDGEGVHIFWRAITLICAGYAEHDRFRAKVYGDPPLRSLR